MILEWKKGAWKKCKKQRGTSDKKGCPFLVNQLTVEKTVRRASSESHQKTKEKRSSC